MRAVQVLTVLALMPAPRYRVPSGSLLPGLALDEGAYLMKPGSEPADDRHRALRRGRSEAALWRREPGVLNA